MGLYKFIILFLFCAKLILPHEVSELFSTLPALFEHYKAHRSSDSSINFTGFISLHYQDTRHHASDHQEHDKLPFSHHHHNAQCSQATLLFEPSSVLSLQFKNISTGHISFTGYTDTFYTDHCNPVWQPPKIS